MIDKLINPTVQDSLGCFLQIRLCSCTQENVILFGRHRGEKQKLGNAYRRDSDLVINETFSNGASLVHDDINE